MWIFSTETIPNDLFVFVLCAGFVVPSWLVCRWLIPWMRRAPRSWPVRLVKWPLALLGAYLFVGLTWQRIAGDSGPLARQAAIIGLIAAFGLGVYQHFIEPDA